MPLRIFGLARSSAFLYPPVPPPVPPAASPSVSSPPVAPPGGQPISQASPIDDSSPKPSPVSGPAASAPANGSLVAPAPTAAESSSIVGPVVGGVVGAAVGISGVGGFLFFCFVYIPRRNKSRSADPKPEGSKEPSPPSHAYSTIHSLEVITSKTDGDAATPARPKKRRRKTPKAGTVSEWKPEWLIPFQDLTFDKKIGQGAFGTVFSGHWKGTKVAVR
jgi:hypothetical protein